jgi:hypothetical protein
VIPATSAAAQLGNDLRPRRSLRSDPPLPGQLRHNAARSSSDAGLLRTASHWGRTMVFGTMADPLWPVIVAFCTVPVLLLAALSIISGAQSEALLAQSILTCGTFVSLRLLSNYPMVNPVHAVVLLFHWWFGFGPSVCAVFWSWKGDSARADEYLTGGMTPALIVAFGLPIYASAAHWVLRHWRRPQLTRLAPDGPVYEIGTLLRIGAVAALASLALQVLSLFGLRAYNTVNYLGGQATETWWLVPFAEAGRLVDFALVIACSLLAVPNLRKGAATRWVMLGIAFTAGARALTSGSKGPLVLPAFYFIVAFVNWRRRLPWLVLIAGLFGYLGVVEPFVATMRLQAEKARATTGEDRVEIFSEGWRDFHIGGQGRDVNVESLFRGIYPLAKQIADQSSFMEGPWKGQSVRDGLSALVPRVLFPNKADSNMGNFFARQLGVSGAADYFNNVAITIPFEIVGNYGWLAGWFSFAVIGVVWASFVAFVLTVPRMTTHPLTPYLIAFVMAVESSVGQFGNAIKMLPISLAVLYWVCRMTHKRSSV